MGHFLVDPFTAGFMRRAMLEVVLLGVLGGVVGVHVLLRRLAFLTEAVQHTVFPGIAIAFVLRQSLLAGALVAGLAAITLVALGSHRRHLEPDGLMAVLISTFFAVGVVVVSTRRGFQSDLTALLFGRVLSVDQRELIDTAVVAALCVVVLAALHKELVLRAFDPTAARAMGYAVGRLDLVLNAVIMLAVVVAVRAVGTVLVVAFVITPAAAARLLSRRVGVMFVVAAMFAATGGWLGLAVSYEGSVRHGWRLASGATVVTVYTAAFVLIAGGRGAVRAARRGRTRDRAPAVPPAAPAVP